MEKSSAGGNVPTLKLHQKEDETLAGTGLQPVSKVSLVRLMAKEYGDD